MDVNFGLYWGDSQERDCWVAWESTLSCARNVASPFCIPAAVTELLLLLTDPGEDGAKKQGSRERRTGSQQQEARQRAASPRTGHRDGAGLSTPTPMRDADFLTPQLWMGALGDAEQGLMVRADLRGLSAAGSDTVCVKPKGKDKLCLPHRLQQGIYRAHLSLKSTPCCPVQRDFANTPRWGPEWQAPIHGFVPFPGLWGQSPSRMRPPTAPHGRLQSAP